MKKGTPEDYEQAYRAMVRLRNTELQACRDFYLAHKQLELEQVFTQRQRKLNAMALEHGVPLQMVDGVRGYFTRFGQLFTTPRIRRATLAACTIMLAQQLCGINVLAFYSNWLFAQAGTDSRSALLYSWGFFLVNTMWVFLFPSPSSISTTIVSRYRPFETLIRSAADRSSSFRSSI
jgi:hypothetical protein